MPTVAMVMILGLVGSGCGAKGREESSPITVRGVSMIAELDAQSGAVILPYDRFVASKEETEALTTAASFTVSACAAEKGVVFHPVGVRFDVVYDSELYFGPWTSEQAQRFGFAMPMTDRDLVANGIVAEGETEPVEAPPNPNLQLTDADWKVMDSCGTSPEARQYLDAASSGPWEEPLSAASASLLDDDDAQKLVHQLETCLTEAGLTPLSEAPGFVQGANAQTISEDQIRMALHVVECKEQMDFTNGMAQIEAQLQAPIIEEYADELVAKRHTIDELVIKARAVIAAAPPAEPQG